MRVAASGLCGWPGQGDGSDLTADTLPDASAAASRGAARARSGRGQRRGSLSAGGRRAAAGGERLGAQLVGGGDHVAQRGDDLLPGAGLCVARWAGVGGRGQMYVGRLLLASRRHGGSPPLLAGT
jgi:hypothetical protein